MSKKIFSIAALALVFGALSAKAQRQTNFAIWGDGGLTGWTSNIDLLQTKTGSGAGGGLGFEWWSQAFLFGVGAEYQYSTLNGTMKDFSFSRIGYDSENELDTVTFRYPSASLKDNYKIHALNIPVWIGVQNKSLYALGGLKVGFNLSSKATINSISETSAVYDWSSDAFKNMPNHELTTRAMQKSAPISFNTALVAHAEVGVYLGGRKTGYYDKASVRLAVFGNYTFTNFHKKATENFIYDDLLKVKINDDGVIRQYLYPSLNPLLLSKETTMQIKDFAKPDQITYLKMNPWFVGVKLTVLFKLSKKPCHCDYD